jgi:hypothetical protein
MMFHDRRRGQRVSFWVTVLCASSAAAGFILAMLLSSV